MWLLYVYLGGIVVRAFAIIAAVIANKGEARLHETVDQGLVFRELVFWPLTFVLETVAEWNKPTKPNAP